LFSSVRTGNFYSPWPLIDGKNLQYQWGEIRSNTAETKALVRGSFQDIEDGADSLNALRALIGLAFGEQGFDNKYRLMYNKVSEEFCAQKNDGTEAVPVWEDVWCIRFSDGQFQVTSEGGIQSNAGFYGPLPHDLLAIGEILTSGALGGTQFANPNELYFNTNTGFYLTSVTSGPRAGKPIVNFAFPFGKSKSFNKTGRVWQITHNFNTSPVLIQTMNDQDVIVIPDKVDVSDRNVAWFYFNVVTSGKALIATGGTGAVDLLPALGVTDGDNVYTHVDTLNFSDTDFYLSSNLAGSPVVNLEVFDKSQTFDGTVTADAFYLTPGSGGEMSKSGNDLLIKSRDGQVVIDDQLLVTDKVTAEAFYIPNVGEVNSLFQNIRVITTAVNLPSISSNGSEFIDTAVANTPLGTHVVSFAATTDATTIDDLVVQVMVVAADTVRITMINPTAGAINPDEITFEIVLATITAPT
jgi:hypothetical protein